MMKKHGSKKKVTGETSNIIIDEWDIQLVQSSHRRVISELIAKEMEKIFSDVVHTNCSGCINFYNIWYIFRHFMMPRQLL